MRVLVLNSGSSSIKYRLFDMPAGTSLAGGLIERIGEARGRLEHRSRGGEIERDLRVPGHAEGFALLLELLEGEGAPAAIGHRVVHGGDRFRAAALIDPGVREAIRTRIHLAPLHNAANLTGIDAALAACPGVPQVAVFDTAFHQTMPPRAWRYAIPDAWYLRHAVRRYGFHGTSHGYVAREAAGFLDRDPGSLSLVVLHLGNGASAAAVQGGRSVDTSMGLTPLEGLVMGTRSGDLDPAVHAYLARRARLSPDEVDTALNEASGLKGLCGENDMREVERRAADGDERAELALDVFCYRARKYVGAYAAAMGALDALVFTAGIGENSATVRRRICAGLGVLGLSLDEARNAAPGPLPAAVHAADSRVAALVIATDEELEIARETAACLENASPTPLSPQPS